MLRRIGMIAGLAGSLAGIVGALWFILLPTPDANIGAGMLVLAGLASAVLGVVLLSVSLAVGASRGRISA